MKKQFYAAVLFTVAFTVSGFAQIFPPLRQGDPGVSVGYASRYWDGCKASCSFLRKSATLIGASKNCDINNNEIPVVDSETDNNACQMRHGGAPFAYTCWDMAPFADPSNPALAYAFAATPGIVGDQCGKCFQLQFVGQRGDGFDPIATHAALNNKTLIVMASNIGHDVVANQFDLLVPGGGVGQFDSFSGQLGINKSQLGNDWGGFLRDCEGELNWGINKTVEDFQVCLRDKCRGVFSDPKHKLLLDGCIFYADWMMAANNPRVLWKALDECPAVLVDRFMEGSGGNNPVPGVGYTSPPRRTILTVQANRGDGNMTNFSNGATATYTVNTPVAGTYAMTFGIAAGMEIRFSVTVNGHNVGTVFLPNGTGDWSTVRPIPLDAEVNLNAGNNTITLNFQSASLGMTYFRLVNEPEPVSVRHGTARTARTATPNVTLKSGVRGFTAVLPANHGYTSYRLLDLRGRELTRGRVGEGMTDLQFNNIRNGVVLLRLDGKNTSTVLRASTVQ